MKKALNSALLVMSMVLVPFTANAAAEKIVVVDMQRVFQQLPQREEVAKKIEAEFGDRMAEVRGMQESLRSDMEKQQKDAALMSAQQKTELARKIESAQADLQLKGKALEEDLRARQNEEQNKLLGEVEAALKVLADKEKYDLIIQRGAVVFASEKTDISDKLVEALSKGN
ncbi:OmpH family outer membrane protein [Paraferrimonas haliotis]|uniref:Molecular chaperone Skp n=1 Tax=Paraferrimonas haliotis TaxID=2013866 RepID=A0AA37TJR2_9GAMM|nr:OmpH family outer membrane protein [Paraferrimonas haliotis]GLS82717.1 molecular chaperone Skp [Paraferrimonas haliotis]